MFRDFMIQQSIVITHGTIDLEQLQFAGSGIKAILEIPLCHLEFLSKTGPIYIKYQICNPYKVNRNQDVASTGFASNSTLIVVNLCGSIHDTC
jgi:hypothetical protein